MFKWGAWLDGGQSAMIEFRHPLPAQVMKNEKQFEEKWAFQNFVTHFLAPMP